MAQLVQKATLITQNPLMDKKKAPKRRKYNHPKGMQLYVFNMV